MWSQELFGLALTLLDRFVSRDKRGRMDIGWPLKQSPHLCSVVYYLLERRLAGIDDRQAYVTHRADVGPLRIEKHCVPTQIPRLTNVPALQCRRLPFSCVVSESCEENPCLPHIG